MSGWLNLCNTVPDSSRPGNRPILKFTKYVYQVLTYYKAGRNLSETRLSSDVCRVGLLHYLNGIVAELMRGSWRLLYDERFMLEEKYIVYVNQIIICLKRRMPGDRDSRNTWVSCGGRILIEVLNDYLPSWETPTTSLREHIPPHKLL